MDSSPHFSKVGNFEIRSGGYGNVLEIPILAEQVKILLIQSNVIIWRHKILFQRGKKLKNLPG